MSSFITLLRAWRINPSEEINSVYIRSAPFILHTSRNGGSLTSSMGASNNGNSPKSIFPILTIFESRQIYDFCRVSRQRFFFDNMHPLMQLLFLASLSLVSAGILGALAFVLV